MDPREAAARAAFIAAMNALYAEYIGLMHRLGVKQLRIHNI